MIYHLIYIDVTKMYLKRLHEYHLSTEAWLSGTVLLILELNRTKIYILSFHDKLKYMYGLIENFRHLYCPVCNQAFELFKNKNKK